MRIRASQIPGLNEALAAKQGPASVVNQSDATYTITETSGSILILCNTTSNEVAVNLPSAVGSTIVVTIKKINSGANAAYALPYLSQTIDDGEGVALNVQYESVTLMSNNVNWFII